MRGYGAGRNCRKPSNFGGLIGLIIEGDAGHIVGFIIGFGMGVVVGFTGVPIGFCRPERFYSVDRVCRVCRVSGLRELLECNLFTMGQRGQYVTLNL